MSDQCDNCGDSVRHVTDVQGEGGLIQVCDSCLAMMLNDGAVTVDDEEDEEGEDDEDDEPVTLQSLRGVPQRRWG